MDTTVSDPIGIMQKIIPHLMRIIDESGVDLPPNPSGILSGPGAGLLAQVLPGFIPAGVGGETAAAVTAARLALCSSPVRHRQDRTSPLTPSKCSRDAPTCSPMSIMYATGVLVNRYVRNARHR